MNNFLTSVVFFLLISCSGNKELLNTFKQQNPVVINLSKKHNKIHKINIPIGLTVKNKSFSKKSFITIDYIYNPHSEGIGEDVYSFESKKLIKIKNNKKKVINMYSSKDYIIYSVYRLDSLQLIQKQFEPYIEKMLAQNKDTMHVGTHRI